MYGGEAFAQLAFDGLWTSYAATLSENSTILDLSTQQSAYIDNITESTINLNDIFSEQDNFFEGVVESLIVSDIETASAIFNLSVSEATTIGQAQTITAAFIESITEAWGQTPYSVTELADFGGMAFGASPIAGGLTASGFLPNPTYTVQTNYLDTIAENSVLSDSETISAGYAEQITESFQVANNQTITAQFLEAIVETTNVNDANSIIANFVESIAENLIPADLATATQGFYIVISENAGVASTQLIQANFSESIAENTNLTDFSTQQSTFLESIVENIGILDNACVFGWFSINDIQSPQWGGVSIVIEEIAVFGGATFGGIDYAGSMKRTRNESIPVGVTPTVVWNNVNTNESPNWTVIDNTQKC